MTLQDLLQAILRFLNFPEEAQFEDMRNFLLETGLCRYYLILADDEDKYYSLYSKQEVLIRKAEGLPLDISLSQAVEGVDEGKTYSLLTDPRHAQERVVFAEDGDGSESGGTARFRKAFRSTVNWFRLFMAGCSSGVVDVDTLNRFGSTQGLIMQFKNAKDPLNPILVPVGQREKTLDGIIERRILADWVYPFIFTGNGHELSRVRRCRNCGTYYLGVRASATFCSSKCRMAHYYASRS